MGRLRSGARTLASATHFVVIVVVAAAVLVTGLPVNDLLHSTTAGRLSGAHPSLGSQRGRAATAASPMARPLPSIGHATSATAVQWYNFTSSIASPPEGRNREALAYDAADGYTLMFGGYDPAGGGWLGDTWIYHAKTWTQLHPTFSPAPRSSAMMVYDPALGGCLLFGGYNYNTATFYNDTWFYRAGSWTELFPTAAPLGRSEATLTYDPVVGAPILFGGYNQVVSYGDTWEYTGTNWVQLFPTISPPAREAASMGWDNTSQSVVLFGGVASNGGILGDTWTYSQGDWGEVFPANAPAPAYYTSSTTLPNGSLIMTGIGDSTTNTLQTWLYSNGSWSELQNLNHASFRNVLGLTYDAADGYVLMFGGKDITGWLHETWAYDMTHLAFGTFVTSGQAPFVFHPFVNESFGAGNASIAWSFGPLGSGVGTAPNYVFNSGGTFSVGVVSEDGLHLGVSLQTSVTVTLPVTITSTPTIGEAPIAITLQAFITNGTGPYAVAWNFGDGTNVHGGTSVVHEYGVGGSFQVTAGVTDPSGGTGFAELNISLVPLLTVTIHASPSSGPGPLAVSFSSTVSGGSGPFYYAWNFGDGNVGTGSSATHTFVVAGLDNVTLKVTDQYGKTANATVAISVQAGTGSGSGPTSSGPLGLSVTDWLLVGILGAVIVGVAVVAMTRRRPPAAAPAPPTE